MTVFIHITTAGISTKIVVENKKKVCYKLNK